MQLVLVIVGLFLQFLATGIYIVDIFKGQTKPHFYTYLVWSIVTTIAFLGSLAAGGGYGAWLVGVSALLTIFVMLLCIKYGTKDIQFIDSVFLGGALLSIVPWLIWKDPLWSVVLAVCIDVCGYFPTIRKTWRHPDSEVPSPWALGSIKSATNIFTLSTFNMTTVLFPLEVFIMNGLVAGIVIFRGRRALLGGRKRR